MSEHVHHLVVAYVHRQLSPADRHRVLLHTQLCLECRAALDREEQLVYELKATMPTIGRPRPGQIKQLWPSVWREFRYSSRRQEQGLFQSLGMVMALFMLCIMVSSILFSGPSHVIAAPLPPGPSDVHATETPVHTDEPGQPLVVMPSETASQVIGNFNIPMASPVPVADNINGR